MPDKKPRPIDAALRRAIRNSGITPYQIAKDCGLSKEPVYRFLNGERDIRFKAAVKMAEYLNLELVSREAE